MEHCDMIPGHLLHRVAVVVCSPAFCDHVVEPLLADLQHEWVEASTLRIRTSACIHGYASFWVALAGGLINDARFDFSGFKSRVAIPLAFMGLMAGLVLIGSGARSWVETGRVNWSEALEGLGWMSGLVISIVVGRYRARHAERRAVLGFTVALTLGVTFLILHRLTDETMFRWAFLTSLNMSCPFLVRKQLHQGPAEAGHYR